MRAKALVTSMLVVLLALAGASTAFASKTGGAAFEEAPATPAKPTVDGAQARLIRSVAHAPAAAPAQSLLELTVEEREWLEAHRSIRLGPDPAGPPLEFIDEQGLYQGIAADYAALLEQRLGIRFEQARHPTHAEVVDATRRGEIDLWMAAVRTDEREEYMLFTEPYVQFRAVIISRREEQGDLSLADLSGRSVVGTAGYASIGWLRENVPGIQLVTVPSTSEGLIAVSFGSADLIVVSNALASYYIEQLGLTNLRVAGHLDYTWELSIASRKDSPLLASILQKTLNSISKEERQAIYRAWVVLDEAPTGGLLSPLVLGVGGFLVALGLAAWLVHVLHRRTRRRGTGPDEATSPAGSIVRWPVFLGLATALAALGLLWVQGDRLLLERARNELGRELTAILATTTRAVAGWFEEREDEVTAWATDATLVSLTTELTRLDRTGESLSESLLQHEVGTRLAPVLEGVNYRGFAIVAADGMILASSRFADVGTTIRGESALYLIERFSAPAKAAKVTLPERETGTDFEIMLAGAAIRDTAVPAPVAFAS